MKRVGPAGSQMKGRSSQQIWLPRNRLLASQVSRTFRATTAFRVHCNNSGAAWAFPTNPAQPMNTAIVSCMKLYSGEINCVVAVNGGVFHTTNNATVLKI